MKSNKVCVAIQEFIATPLIDNSLWWSHCTELVFDWEFADVKVASSCALHIWVHDWVQVLYGWIFAFKSVNCCRFKELAIESESFDIITVPYNSFICIFDCIFVMFLDRPCCCFRKLCKGALCHLHVRNCYLLLKWKPPQVLNWVNWFPIRLFSSNDRQWNLIFKRLASAHGRLMNMLGLS